MEAGDDDFARMTKRNLQRLKAAELAVVAASGESGSEAIDKASKAAAELQAARQESEVLHRRWQKEQQSSREAAIRRSITLRGLATSAKTLISWTNARAAERKAKAQGGTRKPSATVKRSASLDATKQSRLGRDPVEVEQLLERDKEVAAKSVVVPKERAPAKRRSRRHRIEKKRKKKEKKKKERTRANPSEHVRDNVIE